MSYPKRITLKMYERQALQSVKDCGVGIIRGGAESHVLFRMRSIISIYNLDLSAGSNRSGDIVVWARGRWKTANEATTGAGQEARVIGVEDTRPRRFAVDRVLDGDRGLMAEMPRLIEKSYAETVGMEDAVRSFTNMARAKLQVEKDGGENADDAIRKFGETVPGILESDIQMALGILKELRKEEIDDSSKVL